jgi:sulfur carrier protein ThiS
MYDEDMDEMMYDEDMEEDMDEGHMDGHGMEEEMDEEIDLEELLNELELEEDEAIVDENEEILDELGRPIYKAEEANYAGYTADRVHESEEFDLDSLLKEINDLEDDKQTDKVTPPNLDNVLAERGLPKKEVMYCKEEKANIQELVQQLDESRTALNTIKGELNEVNLLDSKLLYVNRIFKANNLDDSQKLRVVETLDNAGTIKEAKLIYETIKDTFNVAKSTKTTPKKSIREGLGMASKATGTSTAPRKAILNESNDMVTRMQN